MLDCPHVHTLKRVNCFAMFDIIQRHWVELAGRPRETFAPQMSLDTVLYYPGWRNMAQLQDITRHQPEKNDDTHTHWNTCSKDSTIQVYTMLNLAEPLMWC